MTSQNCLDVIEQSDKQNISVLQNCKAEAKTMETLRQTSTRRFICTLTVMLAMLNAVSLVLLRTWLFVFKHTCHRCFLKCHIRAGLLGLKICKIIMNE